MVRTGNGWNSGEKISKHWISDTWSHQHMHPCPFDFQSLRVWAADERREDELKQMKHVDKERCRRAGYLGPTSSLDSTIFGFLRITCQSLQL